MEELTYLCITFSLERDNEAAQGILKRYIEKAESCITICVEEKIAASLLRLQANSPYAQRGCPGGIIHQIITKLAVIAGYERGCFLLAEEVEK